MSGPAKISLSRTAPDYPLAMMASGMTQRSGSPSWPRRLRCDVVDLPLSQCCGAIASLDQAGLYACPIACVDDRMVFLTAEGSIASIGEMPLGMPPGLCLHGGVSQFPDHLDVGLSVCWVIPPEAMVSDLQSVGDVIAALCAAYAEFTTATRTRFGVGSTEATQAGLRVSEERAA